jgi:FKBP-type peptidyl-prolyl cis-trans isomerase (trigger factor)
VPSQKKSSLKRAKVKICDHRAIKLSPEDIATARTKAKEAPSEFEDTMFGHYLCERLVERVVEKSEIRLPKELIHDRALDMMLALENRLANDSHSLDDYYQATGTNEQELLADFENEAERQLKSRAALLWVATTEGITATDDEYKAEVKRLATNYPLSWEDLDKQLHKSGEDSSIREDISIEKASNFMTDLALAQVKDGEAASDE